MDRHKYRIEVFWSDEDGGYIANVPVLRYCSAFGETYEEALREVLVAMELHLETLRDLDRPIPEPTPSVASEGSATADEFFDAFASYVTDQIAHDPALGEGVIQIRRREGEGSQGFAEKSGDAYKEFLDAMLDQYLSLQEQPHKHTNR